MPPGEPYVVDGWARAECDSWECVERRNKVAPTGCDAKYGRCGWGPGGTRARRQEEPNATPCRSRPAAAAMAAPMKTIDAVAAMAVAYVMCEARLA